MSPRFVPFQTLDKFHRKYKVSSLLGTGGNGSVYICQDINTKSRRAVKIVKTNVRLTYCLQRGMKIPAEVAFWEPLTHANIVKLLEVYTDHSSWYLVMEYWSDHQELFSYLETHGSLSTRDSSRIIRQVVGAISYLHRLGIDHRDIKDENILFHPKTKEIKLIDFGAASHLSPDPYTSLRGTDIYIPPEFYNTGRYQSGPGAVWSIGCLSYILLRADTPFKSPDEVRDFSHFTEETMLVQTKRVDFIRRCLQPVVDKRMRLSEIMYHPWMRF